MELKRIGVGIDFSDDSATASAHALRHAEKAGAELVLIHVVPEVAHGLFAPLEPRYQEVARSHVEERRSELEEMAASLPLAGARVEPLVFEGDPGPTLATAARDHALDLLVLGSHGRTGVRRFLLGSVAERTVRLADASVLIARGAEPPREGYARILVPTDFSEPSEQALEAAIGLAAPGAEVDLLHCWELPIPIPQAEIGVPTLEPLRTQIQDDVDRAGAELLERFRDRGVALRFKKAFRSAAQGIQDELEEGGHPIVVVGSHGRRGLRRWLLGSVAEVTVRHAPCSVLVVKPPS